MRHWRGWLKDDATKGCVALGCAGLLVLLLIADFILWGSL